MKIGFIGAGNMANAIAFGIIKAGLAKADDIYVSAKTAEKFSVYEKEGIHTTLDNQEVVDHSDVILLAIKPHLYQEVIEKLHINNTNMIFVSIAAGISIANMKNYLGFDAKVVRVMPNTPAKVLEGMSVLSYEAPCTKADYESIAAIFKAVGSIQLIPENLMNEVIALTGSSPAYIYYLIDLMAKKAVLYGFGYEEAVTMAAQSVLGSAKMVLMDQDSPETLKKKVCSKGGTTIAALEKLEDGRMESALDEAMDACTKRAYELGK